MKASVCSLVFALLFGAGLPVQVMAETTSKHSLNVDKTLKLTASMRPLALLAEAVGGDNVDVDILVPAGQSPHHFSLRASQRAQLDSADLVMWVGPQFETFLTKTMALAGNSLRLSEADEHDHGHHHDEHHHGDDSHPWLAPDQALLMARRLMQRLQQLDSANQHVYELNYQRLATKVMTLDHALAQRLSGMGDRRYAVAHDAYRSFSEHYGLPEPVVLSVSPEVAPGARKIWELRSQLPEKGCVLVENAHKSKWLLSLGASQNLRLQVVDTLAEDVSLQHYEDFLESVASSFESCLKG